MMAAASIRSAAGPRTAPEETIEWNETAQMALHRMWVCDVDRLLVMAEGEPLGRITRRDLERCEACGNWLDAVMVVDLVRTARDTCN